MLPKHIDFDDDLFELTLLDQRELPLRKAFCVCRTWQDVVEAIRNMTVRGAPAIGVAAAYGCVIAARQEGSRPSARLHEALDAIAAARPTAINLAWAVQKMRAEIERSPMQQGDELISCLLAQAKHIEQQDLEACQAIGRFGAPLVPDGGGVLTHCNAGALATAGYGTALGVLRAAYEQGKRFTIYADETRPLLQGARLTAFELLEDGLDVRLACDNACAALMAQGNVQLVVAGADRIAANGDTANKIGTLGVAIIAHFFGVPFYIAAPLSTIDPMLSTGGQIPIENRSQEEVTEIAGQRVAPRGVEAINMAFDVTPARLIAGIITEAGVLRPPYMDSIAAALHGQGDSSCC